MVLERVNDVCPANDGHDSQRRAKSERVEEPAAREENPPRWENAVHRAEAQPLVGDRPVSDGNDDVGRGDLAGERGDQFMAVASGAVGRLEGVSEEADLQVPAPGLGRYSNARSTE